MDFLRKIFIAEFRWIWKRKEDFFWYQIVLIFSIFILLWIAFWLEEILKIVEISFFPNCWKYCTKEEVFYWKIIEIFNSILFLFSLFFVFRFNSALIQRFTFFKFSGFLETFFQMILTFTKLTIIWFIIFFISNFVLFFYKQNWFYIYNVINLSEIEMVFMLWLLFFVEMVLFLFWMILKKHK